MEEIEGFFNNVSKNLFSKRQRKWMDLPTPEELGMRVKLKDGKKFVNMDKYHEKLEKNRRKKHPAIFKDLETLFPDIVK